MHGLDFSFRKHASPRGRSKTAPACDDAIDNTSSTAARYPPRDDPALRGLVEVRDNEIVRCGGSSGAPGAIGLWAYDADMTGAQFVFTHNVVRAPFGPAASFAGSKQLLNVLFSDLQVENSPRVAYVSSSAIGAATFQNVTVSARRRPNGKTMHLRRSL